MICWACSRMVSFLSATETEVAKVSWPKRDDVFKAAGVVIVTVIVLAIYMFFWDLLFEFIFRVIGYIPWSAS